MKEEPSLFQVERLELVFKPKPWPFATKRRAEIEAYFAELQREKPAIWNGRVLLMHRQVVRDGVFSGDYLETDYASFSAWRAWGRPHAGVHDCFGAAAIIASDGACLLGVMGAQTFNAGMIYFPCGTPDPGDIVARNVDLDFSVRREVKEETGIDTSEFTVEPGWTTVADGALIAQIKVLRSPQTAEALATRMRDYLSHEKNPELSDIRIVRSPRDFTPAMPTFVTAFLARHFGVL
ncbi:MAG TPA: NUDIX hydrolase [Xanthobacteraceae bacterium]|jgi:8-oxo-dGTP pyrophosphatase MutT (NUDIX family)|nr:NUDIX hydrolase [Xanthobacteraceae bacterium]